MKAVLAVLALCLAFVVAQSSNPFPCTGKLTTFDCLSASTDRSCCLWCVTASSYSATNVGKCVDGFVSFSTGRTTACIDNKCDAIAGQCSGVANCQNTIPYINGTWFYPPFCSTFGGQFAVTLTPSTGQFRINSTSYQELRIPQYIGTVDSNGNLVMTDPNTGNQCVGAAGQNEMMWTCSGSDCTWRIYRSAGATLTFSLVALLVCLALHLALF